eukprot:TRINITY_DN1552_c0_g1_i1.p1 TRINITY_DN1552_c0_g1~~TRINITY_DN1552_c0_g1_i1.p1  ORF type:complete len:470 (-),score=89.99 TRINITY_DN1552_c0_g1_i1:68-1477(-)
MALLTLATVVAALSAVVLILYAFGYPYRLWYHLPPGVFGLPWIGETLNWAKEPRAWLLAKRKKHGDIFLSHLLGRPTIVVTGIENLDWLFKNEMGYLRAQGALPPVLYKLLGKDNITNLSTDENKFLRKIMTPHLLSREALKDMTPKLERFVAHHVKKWERMEVINNWYRLGEELAFDYACYVIWGDEDLESEMKQRAFRCFLDINEAVVSLPVDLPGTNFHKGIVARQELLRILHEELVPIAMSKENGGFIKAWIEEYDRSGEYDPSHIGDVFITILFGAHHSISSLLVNLCLKLGQYPEVRQRIRDEIALHIPEGEPLSYANLQKLTFLDNVEQECLRLASGDNVQRVVDVPFKYKGFDFPKEFLITVAWGPVHVEEKTYADSFKFDPDRWDRPIKPVYVFGVGAHNCIGRMFALLEAKIMTLYLCKGYDWTITPGQDLTPVDTLAGQKPVSNLQAVLRPLETNACC